MCFSWWKENTFFELVTTYLTDKSIILRLENWYVENRWICLKTWENQCHDLKFRCATHFVFTFPNQNKGSETLTTAPTRRITVLHWYSHIRYFGKAAELKLQVFVDSFLESSFLVGSKCSVEGLLVKGGPLLLTTLEFCIPCRVLYKGESAWTNCLFEL